jgi:putative sporulation protein YyaC
LKKYFHDASNIKIIGDLENVVCSSNISHVLQRIEQTYTNPFIIAIDSALSKQENVGKIIVSPGGIYLGTGVGKKKVYVGDMNIKGVVARNLQNPKYNMSLLQNTHLGFIMNMADIVANGIHESIEYR